VTTNGGHLIRQPHDPLLRYRVLNILERDPEGGWGLHASQIVERTGCAAGGLHLALQRMEQAGWVTSRLQGHRRYYQTQPAGLKALAEAREAIGA
jgi:DNA-binding PadR family transcriptional regulator